MPTTYYLSTSNSDLTGVTFNKVLAPAAAGGAAGSITISSWNNNVVRFYTPAGNPGSSGVTGMISIELPVSAAEGDIFVQAHKVNSAGNIMASTGTDGIPAGTGNHLVDMNLNLGAWAAGDRFAIEVRGEGTITLAAGDGANQQVLTPWSTPAHAGYTLSASGASYSVTAAGAGTIRSGAAAAKTLFADPITYAATGSSATLSASGGPSTISAEQVRDSVAAALVPGPNISIAADDAADTITISTSALNAEQVLDRVAAALIAGSGINVVHNDLADTITLSATGSGLTAEDVRDTIGTALVAGTGISVSVDDATDKITISAPGAGLTTEDVRDTIGTALVAGSGIAIDVNDATDKITISAQVSEIGLFTEIPNLNIPFSVQRIRTTGHSEVGKGGAEYVYSPIVTASFAQAHPGWTVRSLNGRGYMLSVDQQVYFEVFGARGDHIPGQGGTDDYPIWIRAKDFLHYHQRALTGNAYYKVCPALHFRPTNYYMSNFIDLTDGTYAFVGAGGGELGGSWFYFAPGIPGIVLQSWDTSGIDGTKANTPSGANHSRFSDIKVRSTGGNYDTSCDGFRVKCQAHFYRCGAYDFPRHGFCIIADGTSGVRGNANAVVLENCTASNNGGSGLFMSGGDTNACRNVGFQAFFNREWGICDQSFLGNDHTEFQLDGNGRNVAHPNYKGDGLGAGVHYNGRRYRVKPGAHVAARTTVPGTNGNVWIDQGAGGQDGIHPTWTNGADATSGGAFYCGSSGYTQNNNTRSTFQGYCEPNQKGGWFDSETCVGMPGNLLLEKGQAIFTPRQNSIQAGCIGANTTDGSGRTYKYLLGSNKGAFDAERACIARFGSDGFDDAVWEMWCTAQQEIHYKYAGSFISPMNSSGFAGFQPSGRQAPAQYVPFFERGIYVGQRHNAKCIWTSGGPGSGGIADGWGIGDIILNESPSSAEPWGWRKLEDHTWQALMP